MDIETKLDNLQNKVYNPLTPWDRVQICRHPARPHTIDYIKNICDEFIELFGDRQFRDDPAIMGGFALIDGQKFMVIGQEKGENTEKRIERNFGMAHPEGFRKALRLAYMAEKFQLPILFIIDTPGAFPGLSAEERGQGWAIAMNLRELFRIKTPIIVLIVGEGCSGGALAIGIGDRIAMLEHAYYSVISPEGCASILWKEAGKREKAAEILKMQAENLKEFEIIDTIIREPLGGAHCNREEIFFNVKEYLIATRAELSQIPSERLLQERYQKFRHLGAIANIPCLA